MPVIMVTTILQLTVKTLYDVLVKPIIELKNRNKEENKESRKSIRNIIVKDPLSSILDFIASTIFVTISTIGHILTFPIIAAYNAYQVARPVRDNDFADISSSRQGSGENEDLSKIYSSYIVNKKDEEVLGDIKTLKFNFTNILINDISTDAQKEYYETVNDL